MVSLLNQGELPGAPILTSLPLATLDAFSCSTAYFVGCGLADLIASSPSLLFELPIRVLQLSSLQTDTHCHTELGI